MLEVTRTNAFLHLLGVEKLSIRSMDQNYPRSPSLNTKASKGWVSLNLYWGPVQGCTWPWFSTTGNCSGQNLLCLFTQEQVSLFPGLTADKRPQPLAPARSFSASLGLGAPSLPLGGSPAGSGLKGYLGASGSGEAARAGQPWLTPLTLGKRRKNTEGEANTVSSKNRSLWDA